MWLYTFACTVQPGKICRGLLSIILVEAQGSRGEVKSVWYGCIILFSIAAKDMVDDYPPFLKIHCNIHSCCNRKHGFLPTRAAKEISGLLSTVTAKDILDYYPWLLRKTSWIIIHSCCNRHLGLLSTDDCCSWIHTFCDIHRRVLSMIAVTDIVDNNPRLLWKTSWNIIHACFERHPV